MYIVSFVFLMRTILCLLFFFSKYVHHLIVKNRLIFTYRPRNKMRSVSRRENKRKASNIHIDVNENNNNNKSVKKQRKARFTPAIGKVLAAKQQWKCGHCSTLLSASYQVDHKVPLCLGGKHDISNGWVLCANCHADKSLAECQSVTVMDHVLNKDPMKTNKPLLLVNSNEFYSYVKTPANSPSVSPTNSSKNGDNYKNNNNHNNQKTDDRIKIDSVSELTHEIMEEIENKTSLTKYLLLVSSDMRHSEKSYNEQYIKQCNRLPNLNLSGCIVKWSRPDNKWSILADTPTPCTSISSSKINTESLAVDMPTIPHIVTGTIPSPSLSLSPSPSPSTVIETRKSTRRAALNAKSAIFIMLDLQKKHNQLE
jgi:5-methylcytosine-specific restriction endonuclease McrA